MDMVEGVRAPGIGGSTPVVRDGMKTVEPGFAVDDGNEPLTQQARLSSIVALGLENMLALQEVDGTTDRDRGARKRGAAMIAALTDLQRIMLADQDPASALRALNELAAGDSEADDPRLGAILRAIVLRTRIEIARRQRQG
jgi:hypothetical protein